MAKFIQVMQLLLELKGEDNKTLEEDYAALKVWSLNHLVLSICCQYHLLHVVRGW